jgi:hypothetical protein
MKVYTKLAIKEFCPFFGNTSSQDHAHISYGTVDETLMCGLVLGPRISMRIKEIFRLNSRPPFHGRCHSCTGKEVKKNR